MRRPGRPRQARRSVEPSTLSLLGLVRHMAEVERNWFRRVLAGEEAPRIFCTPQDHDGDFNGAVADPAVVEEAWRAWREECAFADRFVAETSHLGMTDADQPDLVAGGAGAHDRGVLPAQLARRPGTRADRRKGWRVGRTGPNSRLVRSW